MDKTAFSNLNGIKRVLPSFLKVNTIMYIPSSFHRHESCHNSIDFGIELSSKAHEAAFLIDDKPYTKKFPWMSTRMPGHRYQMQTSEPWEVLFFVYDIDKLEKLRSFGIDPEHPGWEFTMTPEIFEIINTIKGKKEQLFMSGFTDMLDMLSLQLLHAIVLNNKIKIKENKPEASIQLVASYLQGHILEKIDFDEVIKKFNFSRRSFFRHWKNYFQITPMQFIIAKRIELACYYLTTSDMKIYEISDALHFIESSYFARVFKSHIGITPYEYKKQRLNLQRP